MSVHVMLKATPNWTISQDGVVSRIFPAAQGGLVAKNDMSWSASKRCHAGDNDFARVRIVWSAFLLMDPWACRGDSLNVTVEWARYV